MTPNILFIFTDQQTASAMSCTGNADLQTPHLDRLAAEGVRFNRAYCNFPLCTPSRASLMSGRMPHEVGVMGNDTGLSDEDRLASIGCRVREAGYSCAYGGKWHLPTSLAAAEDHGFEVLCGMQDSQLADRCIRFIQREHEQPFFLVASFDNPHNTCEYARNQSLPWGPVAEPPSLAACPNLPANFGERPYEPSCLREEQRKNVMAYAGRDFSPDRWRRQRWGYFRLVEKVDREIGRILEALREAGLEEETLIVFTSDHGEANGAHSWNQKTCLYEESIRVPLLVRAPETAEPGRVAEGLVSIGLDLYTTFCDYAGAKPPDGLRGQSLRPVLSGENAAAGHDEVVVETSFSPPAGHGTRGRCLVTDRYKYTVYSWGENREQLCDLTADPGELVNLAVEERYAPLLDELRERLYRAIQATDDTFPLSNGRREISLIPGYDIPRKQQEQS